MQLGLIGLGRMGGRMLQRLQRDGHTVVGLDVDKDRVRAAVEAGAEGADSLEALVAALAPPRAVWVMVPHGRPTDETLDTLLPRLEPGDVVVDGGNNHYRDSLRHAADCHARDLLFLDVGVSGGVWGLEVGHNLMVGGPREAFERLEPALRSLAPPRGYAHLGPSGGGHFVKMLHNGLEYAMLAAIGEAFECLARAP